MEVRRRNVGGAARTPVGRADSARNCGDAPSARRGNTEADTGALTAAAHRQRGFEVGRQTGLQAVEPGTITPTALYADHCDLTGTLSPTDTCNGGAGGGVSSVFARPDHQTAAGTRTTAGSVRAVPDTVADHDGSTGVGTPNAAILPPALAAAVKAAP